MHENTYHRLSEIELAEVSVEMGELHSPHGFTPGVANIGQQVYARKFTSDYMREMNRSVTWWLTRWSSAE
ncbi:MAG: hypothetical protein Q7U89_00170 [Coriobacteriia bacterium]|nr:hypothetical protein [Coriobacteriia bacterium]